MEQAEELADRVGLLVAGRVREEGTPPQLVERAFGGAREVAITLARRPDDATALALEGEGLRSDESSLIWIGPLPGGFENLARLGQRLAAAGAAVAELRLREPGLRGVFLKLGEGPA
jgi:ABC-type multidrug transport system ATPase subunit